MSNDNTFERPGVPAADKELVILTGASISTLVRRAKWCELAQRTAKHMNPYSLVESWKMSTKGLLVAFALICLPVQPVKAQPRVLTIDGSEGEHERTEPVETSEPAEPAELVEPAEPAEPAAPTEPTEPEEPTASSSSDPSPTPESAAPETEPTAPGKPIVSVLGNGFLRTQAARDDANAIGGGGGLSLAVTWPSATGYVLGSVQTGSARTLGDRGDVAEFVLSPSTSKLSLSLDVSRRITQSFGGSLDGSLSIQGGAAQFDFIPGDKPASGIVAAPDLGVVQRWNTDGEIRYGVDIGIGASARFLLGDLSSDERKDLRRAAFGRDARHFFGGYFSLGLRAGTARVAFVVPILSGKVDGISRGQFVVLVELQGKLLEKAL